METIPHRELRNHSSEILARVQRGESFTVTNHGEVAAVITPPGASSLERRRAAGQVRPARAPLADFAAFARRPGDSRDILDDLRGDR